MIIEHQPVIMAALLLLSGGGWLLNVPIKYARPTHFMLLPQTKEEGAEEGRMIGAERGWLY